MLEGLNLTSLRKHDPEEAIYGSSLVGVVRLGRFAYSA